jgi:hypothetical protein
MKRAMISVDGDTEIPLKADGGFEWSYAGMWKVVRLPGRGAWKRTHPLIRSHALGLSSKTRLYRISQEERLPVT